MLAIIVPIQIILMFGIIILSFIVKKIRQKEWINNIYVLFTYLVATIVVIMPITDKAHFGIGIICTLISFIYCIYLLFSKISKKDENLKKTMKIFFEISSEVIFICVIFYSIYLFAIYMQSGEKRNDIKHFDNIIIEDYLYNEINNIDKYIIEKEKNGKTVYILDVAASIFMIPLDKYNKNYDMFNMGNFGEEGVSRHNRGYKEKRKSCIINKKS